MVIFHSYVKLPEGNFEYPMISLGPTPYGKVSKFQWFSNNFLQPQPKPSYAKVGEFVFSHRKIMVMMMVMMMVMIWWWLWLWLWWWWWGGRRRWRWWWRRRRWWCRLDLDNMFGFANGPCAHKPIEEAICHQAASCEAGSGILWCFRPWRWSKSTQIHSLIWNQQPPFTLRQSNLAVKSPIYINDIEWASQRENHRIKMVAFPARLRCRRIPGCGKLIKCWGYATDGSHTNNVATHRHVSTCLHIIYINIYNYMYSYKCKHSNVANRYTCICTCVYIYICKYIYIYIYIYICITFAHVQICYMHAVLYVLCACTCMCIYIICIYIYIHGQLYMYCTFHISRNADCGNQRRPFWNRWWLWWASTTQTKK